MVNIFEDLQELNKPIYVEGDAPEDLADEYYTVSEDATSNAVSADNRAKEHLYEFTLKWYTKNTETLYTGLQEAITLLLAKGYDIEGIGSHNPTYRNTWYSRAVDIEKIDNLEV